jgi:CysZ protein
MKALLSDIGRSLKVQVAKVLVYLAGLAALFAIHLIPIIGTVFYPVLIFVYTLFFLGWEYCDYSMERWKYTFRQKLRASLKNAFAFAGFGAGASLMLFIPLANLMAIPVCAVGATLMFCDLRKEGRISAPVRAKSEPRETN